jgi:hypothetical protein
VRKSPPFDEDKRAAIVVSAVGQKNKGQKNKEKLSYFSVPYFFVRRLCVAETTTRADKKRLFAADRSVYRVIFANSLETRIRCENN